MKVLLVGIDRVPHLGMSFRSAFQKIGHEVLVVDPSSAYTFLDRRPFGRITQRLRCGLPSGYGRLRKRLCATARDFKPQVVVVIGGCLDGDLVQEIRALTGAPLVMFSTDNPFNPLASPGYVLRSLPFWDAIATPRRASIPQLQKHCRKTVFYLPFAYDPDLHFPEQPSSESERCHFASDVTFIGGCDRDRIDYLDPLARCSDLAVSFYGGYYNFTPALRQRHRGYVYGRPYRLVLSTTRVAICIVRRANSDGHVMRTFEIPACGAFQLLERTDEHESMFEEDREACFFSSPEEMLEKSKFYAHHQDLRNKIAEAGYRRITTTENTYANRAAQILGAIQSLG